MSRLLSLVAVFVVILAAVALYTTKANGAGKTPIPAAAADAQMAHAPGKEMAVFAGVCFWGTQSVFERVNGVLDTTAGYAGGSAETATYDQVSSETTGHAESVRVEYDPSQITYGQLLRGFFSVVHDPTQLNRQGPMWGLRIVPRSSTRARSNAGSARPTSRNSMLPGSSPSPSSPRLCPLKGFYDAESNHQDYAQHNPDNPYILVCDRPKVEHLKQQSRSCSRITKGSRAEAPGCAECNAGITALPDAALGGVHHGVAGLAAEGLLKLGHVGDHVVDAKPGDRVRIGEDQGARRLGPNL